MLLRAWTSSLKVCLWCYFPCVSPAGTVISFRPMIWCTSREAQLATPWKTNAEIENTETSMLMTKPLLLLTAKTVSNRVGLYWGELSPLITCNCFACRRIRMPMGQANSQQQFSNDCGAPTEVLPKAFPKEKPWKGHGALKQLIVSLLAIIPTTLLPRMWMLGSRTRKMYTTSTKAIESIGQRPNKVTLHICKAHQAATNLSWEFQEVNTGKQFSKTYTTELIDHDCEWKWKRNHARSCHSVQHTVESHGYIFWSLKCLHLLLLYSFAKHIFLAYWLICTIQLTIWMQSLSNHYGLVAWKPEFWKSRVHITNSQALYIAILSIYIYIYTYVNM